MIFAALEEPTSKRLTGTHAAFSFEDVQAHCAMVENAKDRWDYGIIFFGCLVGEVVLNQIDWNNKSSSFRIAIWDPKHRNKGLGSEATGLLVKFGFCSLGLNRIEREVYAFNPQAIRTYEKVGFKLEGTKREALIWRGEMVDAHIMGLLARDRRLVPAKVDGAKEGRNVPSP